jgi:hypothetical protein
MELDGDGRTRWECRPSSERQMVDIKYRGTKKVVLSNGVAIGFRDPISDAEIHDGIVVVVLRWMSGRRRARRRTVRRENVYGYDLAGGLVWRVAEPDSSAGPLYYTGFVEEGPPVTLHVASGWHVVLDPRTGRIVQADSVR